MIRGPHRTGAFLRLLDSGPVWTVAFSVPVLNDKSRPVGIIGMTDDLIEDEAKQDASRFAVLVDTRPDSRNGKRGLILRHPYWSTLADSKNPPLYYAESVVEWADSQARPDQFAEREDYVDPVATGDANTPGIPKYAGSWLASLHRVRSGPELIDTGWVIVVQERRDEVMPPGSRPPVAAQLWSIGSNSLRAVSSRGPDDWDDVSTGCAPKSRITRALRRWAGLPTGTSSVGSITTGTSGSLGARTARMDATPGQSSQAGEPNPGGETPHTDRPTPDT